MAINGELLDAVKGARIVPFVGAGVSMGVKRDLFPSWKRLIEALAGRIAENGDAAGAARVLQLRDSGDYPQAAEVAYQLLGPFHFNRALRAAIRVRRPGDGDLSVPAGVWALRPPLVITTNYDDVLTWACPGDLTVVANDQPEELGLLDHDKSREAPWLWHLHGSIQRLGTVILAGGDYKRLYGDGSARVKDYEGALFRLRTVMASYPLLYVGFSLSDPYVLQQIKHVLDLTDRMGPPSYALMKAGEGDAAALWSNYNIRLVEYADHGRPLVELLGEIALRAFPPPPPGPFSPPSGPWLVGARPLAMAGAAPPPPPLAVPAFGPPAPLAAPERVVAARLAAPISDAAGMSPDDVIDSAEAAPVTPEPEPTRPARVPRHALEDAYLDALLAERRLLLLGPRRGGARTLARALAHRHFGPRVTWLSPPNVPGADARAYYRALTGEESVESFADLESWLHARAQAGGGEHLVVLAHDGGPLDRLMSLGNLARRLLSAQPTPFAFVAAGGASCAWLRQNSQPASLFSGIPVRHVPPLTVEEVERALAGAHLDEARAAEVHAAMGGLPGLLEEVLVSGVLDAAAITARLSRSPAVAGVLRARLSEDDRQGVEEKRHARTALRELLAGRALRPLAEVEDELQHPEVRLYYDGLVVPDAAGATVFRCEAARLAAEEALRE
jgi:hypothetical protein